MDELKYYDRIDAYHEKRMSVEDASKFEQELLSNEELKLENDAYLMTMEAALAIGYEHLKEQKSSTTSEPGAIVRKIKSRWMMAAASILLLAGCSLQYANKSYTNEALALNKFTDPNVAGIRAENESTLFAQIEEVFNSKEYKRVVDMVQGVNANDSIYLEVQFIAGHANIYLKEYSKAISGLRIAASDENFMDSDNAQWNLALSYVLTGQTDLALGVLDKLAEDPNADYYQLAIDLRRKLQSFWRKLVI